MLMTFPAGLVPRGSRCYCRQSTACWTLERLLLAAAFICSGEMPAGARQLLSLQQA